MNNYYRGGNSMIIIWIGSLALSITSGILSWNWIEPESFGGGILWLLVWGFLSYVGHIIIGLIVVAFSESGNGQQQISPQHRIQTPNRKVDGNTSFTVISRNRNHEYVLSHEIYGSQIHMNSDDFYNPRDIFELEMNDYKIVEIEIQRSPDKITKEKWVLPR